LKFKWVSREGREDAEGWLMEGGRIRIKMKIKEARILNVQ